MDKSDWHWRIKYNDDEAIAKALKQRRKELGKSQTQIAEHLNSELHGNYTQKSISDWETFRIKKIPQNVLLCWRKYLEFGGIAFCSVEFPPIPVKDARPTQSVQVREFFNVLKYVFEHYDEEWLCKDTRYSRSVKNDMRELLECYLRERDEELQKQQVKADNDEQ